MSAASTKQAVSRPRGLPIRGALATVLAVLVNAVLVVGIGALGLAPDFQALTVPPVVFLSAVGAVGATAVYGLLGRYVDDVDRTFLRVATVVLLLSFIPDIALLVFDPAATALGVIALMGMHVTVAVVSVGVLSYWGRIH